MVLIVPSIGNTTRWVGSIIGGSRRPTTGLVKCCLLGAIFRDDGHPLRAYRRRETFGGSRATGNRGYDGAETIKSIVRPVSRIAILFSESPMRQLPNCRPQPAYRKAWILSDEPIFHDQRVCILASHVTSGHRSQSQRTISLSHCPFPPPHTAQCLRACISRLPLSASS